LSVESVRTGGAWLWRSANPAHNYGVRPCGVGEPIAEHADNQDRKTANAFDCADFADLVVPADIFPEDVG